MGADTGLRPTRPYIRGASRLSFLPGLRLHRWRGLALDEKGRRRIAVNLRLAQPGVVAGIIIDHFDGLDSFKDLPRDGRCVADMWFYTKDPPRALRYFWLVSGHSSFSAS